MKKFLNGLGFIGLMLFLSWCDVLLSARRLEKAFWEKEERDILADPASMAGDAGMILGCA